MLSSPARAPNLRRECAVDRGVPWGVVSRERREGMEKERSEHGDRHQDVDDPFPADLVGRQNEH